MHIAEYVLAVILSYVFLFYYSVFYVEIKKLQ